MKLVIVGAALASLVLSACSQPTAADKEQQAQSAITAQGAAVVGYPAITHFTMKKQLKEIQELLDQPNYATYTYFVDVMKNGHTPLCHSIGYGISGGTEYTAPESEQKVTLNGTEYTSRLPQADPDALYHSQTDDGTWVLCLFKDNKVLPVRSEPKVVTLPEPWDQLNQDNM
jgi:hypothetical protein